MGTKKKTTITYTPPQKYLSDIAGYEEEKQELYKVINIIKNYPKYRELGVEVPRGLILQGPPGCGKTLMANAISGECGVPFYYFKVGDEGSSNSLAELQKIYKEAEDNSPAIVYIDEISELVTCRRFTSDVSRMNLQFLLTKLDGNQSNEKDVMTIASTNCYGEIPASLVRSGRMDKKIRIDLPSISSREAIIKHYAHKHQLFNNLDTKLLAIKLEGMSGADIKTLVNNALIEYIDNKEYVEVDDFNKLVNEMNFESIGKHWKSRNNLTRVIAHEVGHSIVSWVLDNNPGSITAVRYSNLGGFTNFLYNREEQLVDSYYEENDMTESLTEQHAFVQYCIGLGGAVGELILCGDICNGLTADIDYIRETHKTLCNAGIYGIKTIPYRWSEDSNQHKDVIEKHFYKTVTKAFKTTKRILKKHEILSKYLVDLTMQNNDSLTNAQIIQAIKYYKTNKKELIKKYKNINIMEDK